MTSPLIFGQAVPVPARSPGLADFVGFGESGVTIMRNRFDPVEEFVLADFGLNAGGWQVDRHVRVVADTTGDGSADLVGFGEDGVYISVNKGNNSFAPATKVVSDFAYSAGNWRVDEHLRFMVDLRNTGRADIVGFGNPGILVSLNQGDGKFGPTQLALNNFAVNTGGWNLTKHLRFVADVNGDKFPDIVGFGDPGVYVSLGNGDGTFQAQDLVIQDLGFNQGWQVDQNPRFVAELNGDGKPDIIGFGNDGVHVALNNGDGTFQPPRVVLDDYSSQQGWHASRHQWSVADITGDGAEDIVAFGDQGVYVSVNNGNGTFQPKKVVLREFGYDQGFRVGSTPRWLADMTGNGRADIVGTGSAALYVSFSDGKGGFAEVDIMANDFGNENTGWSDATTVKYATNLYH
ncbi:hypothetical protein CVT26_014611 [Gymnopilus dilepis]|uniref:VCBS repeat-containing protein n=1 Tax=Gymnopilus dilepis TaxID=231916 RepID=A0A409VWM5_9AGAR|nr:hypothetical protein CVT26_014611 [Gymnopilus dilepis]